MNGEMLPKDFYKQPSQAYIYNQMKLIDRFREAFCKCFNIPREELMTNTHTLKDIIIRLDERVLYFHIYHRIHPNEQKKIALWVFWILKLRPFYLPVKDDADTKDAKFASRINELFCMFFMFTTLRRLKGDLLPIERIARCTQEIFYAFRFHDQSKESLYLFMDNIC